MNSCMYKDLICEDQIEEIKSKIKENHWGSVGSYHYLLCVIKFFKCFYFPNQINLVLYPVHKQGMPMLV